MYVYFMLCGMYLSPSEYKFAVTAKQTEFARCNSLFSPTCHLTKKNIEERHRRQQRRKYIYNPLYHKTISYKKHNGLTNRKHAYRYIKNMNYTHTYVYCVHNFSFVEIFTFFFCTNCYSTRFFLLNNFSMK